MHLADILASQAEDRRRAEDMIELLGQDPDQPGALSAIAMSLALLAVADEVRHATAAIAFELQAVRNAIDNLPISP